MTRAIIRHIDVNGEVLESIHPDNPECFGLHVTVSIGPDNEDGFDYFNILVCTPCWIQKEFYWRKSVFGRNMLIVFNYDIDQIKLSLFKEVEKCEGDSWPVIANKISKFAEWEFENYTIVPSERPNDVFE